MPSARRSPNPNGTAPGWWVDRPDGRVIVALPGPPREMRPMWPNEVLPRLAARGLGPESVVRTLRLTGIGESLVAERLGEPLLRADQPDGRDVCPQEAVDVRISARGGRRRRPSELVEAAEAAVLAAARRVRLGDRRRRRGQTAMAEALDARGWTLATVESGTYGALVALLQGVEAVRRSEVRSGEIGDGPPGRGRRPGAMPSAPASGGRRCRRGRPGVRSGQRHRGARRGGHA